MAGATKPVVCPAGQWSNAGAGGCTTCSSGSYCSGGGKYTCDAGTYAPNSGMSSCSTCTVGNYCLAGAISVTACPDGQTSNAGAQNSGQCFSCPAGRYVEIRSIPCYDENTDNMTFPY